MSGDSGFESIALKGFFKSLYDFGFTSFVATRILKILYVILVVLVSIAAFIYGIAMVVASIANGKPALAILSIILVPVFYIIYLAFLRISFEIIMVVFRMAADLRSIATKENSGDSGI